MAKRDDKNTAAETAAETGTATSAEVTQATPAAADEAQGKMDYYVADLRIAFPVKLPDPNTVVTAAQNLAAIRAKAAELGYGEVQIDAFFRKLAPSDFLK